MVEAATVNSKMSEDKYFFDPFIIRVEMDSTGDVWKPTPHGLALANGMVKVPTVFSGKSMIEIGAGSGIHAILALKLGAKSIDITDINQISLTIAQKNADKNQVQYRHQWIKDWMDFEPPEKYDFVLCNPPFCKSGTSDRRWFISTYIRESKRFLKPGGHIMFCQSSMANFPKTEQELTENNYSYEVVHSKRGLFRDYYFTEPGFIEDSRQVENGFEMIDGEYIETLQVYLASRKTD